MTVHRVLSVVVFLLWLIPVTLVSGLEIGGIRIDDSDQRVTVTAKRGSWQTSVAGATQIIPMLTVDFFLGNFNYALRHDGGGPYPNGIGISYPTAYNWYQSDAIGLLINGERYKTGHTSNEQFSQSAEGPRGDALFSWDNDIAQINYDFCGFYMDRNLYLVISINPKVPVTSLALHLNAFPGGHLRASKQRPLQVFSNSGNSTLPPGKDGDLPSDSTDRVLLYRSEDLAAESFCGGCGVVFTGLTVSKVRTTNHFYSQVILDIPPETRLIRLALNELSMPQPTEQFIRQAQVAASRLPDLQPKPFIPQTEK